MKHISIELSPEACKRAEADLKKYQKEVIPKLDKACQMLAEIGLEAARAHLVLDNGNNDVALDGPFKIDNGYKIVMGGKDAYFVEFGTGEFTFAHGNVTSVPVYPGSYSEQHAKQFSSFRFWWYGGEQYEGTPAYRPLFYASQAIRQAIPKVVKEVFG